MAQLVRTPRFIVIVDESKLCDGTGPSGYFWVGLDLLPSMCRVVDVPHI